MEKGFTATAKKDFVSQAPAAGPEVSAPKTEKEYQDAYHSLRQENDDLKNAIAQRDVKIKQLEGQLAALSTK